MERTITIKETDGQNQKQGAGQATQRLAAQGVRGDTELAHVNPWEEILLKALGGAGTVNPNTGLKQFYTPGGNFQNDPAEWYKQAFGREADPAGLAYWTEQDKGTMTDDQLWNSFLASGTNETYTGWTPTSTATGNTFDFPENIGSLYPTSTSTSTGTSNNQSTNNAVNAATNNAVNAATNNAFNTSSNRASGTSKSYSGLPKSYQEQLLAAIIPQLIDQASKMEGNYDTYTNQALGSYQQTMNEAIKKNIPLAIANLANRGILNSTEGQNVLGNVYSSAASDAANKGYESAMQAALGKANIPSILAQIAGLGQSSESQSKNESSGNSYGTSTGNSYGTSTGNSYGTSTGQSTGTSNNASNASSSDPLAVWKMITDFIATMYTAP
jgi:hypothetical protein